MSKLFDALVNLGHLKTIALSDGAFDGDPSTPSVVFGELQPGKQISTLEAFGFQVHTKGSIAGGEAISAEGIKKAVESGALEGRLFSLIGPDWSPTLDDENVARYAAGSQGGNLWGDDLWPLSQNPVPVEPPAPTPKPRPAPTPKPAPKPDPGSLEFRYEALRSDLKRILAALKAPHEGHRAAAINTAIEDLTAALGE